MVNASARCLSRTAGALAARLQAGVLAAGVLELALGGLELLPRNVLGSLSLLTCSLVELDGVGMQALGQIDAPRAAPSRSPWAALSCSCTTATARSVVWVAPPLWLLASRRAACSAVSASASAVVSACRSFGQAHRGERVREWSRADWARFTPAWQLWASSAARSRRCRADRAARASAE